MARCPTGASPLAACNVEAQLRAQVQALCHGEKVLYLYSGPARYEDAVALGRVLGLEVLPMDVLRSLTHDLADQHIWDDVVRLAKPGRFDGFLMSPPCLTYSIVMSKPGGPPPLRGESPPEIFGFSHLNAKEREQVRLGTLIAERGADIADLADNELDLTPWIAETPKVRRGHPSVFKLPRWLQIRLRRTTRQADLDQCEYGDSPPRPDELVFKKGTSILGNLPLHGVHRLCSHSPTDWVVPSTGSVVHAPIRRTWGASELTERAIGRALCRKEVPSSPGQRLITPLSSPINCWLILRSP